MQVLSKNNLIKVWAKVKSYVESKTEGLQYEANLKFGGKSHYGSFSPIDASMIGVLGANRFAGIKNGVTFERSSDGGNTYIEFERSKLELVNFFTESAVDSSVTLKGPNDNIATSEHRLRITIESKVASVYTTLNKIAILVSTDGSARCGVLFEKAKEESPDVFETVGDFKLVGWSGWNILNFSDITTYSNNSSQYKYLRFTFYCGGQPDTNYNGMTVIRILGFGGFGWNTPSILAKTGHLYETVAAADGRLNAEFPNNVKAPSFTGNIDGNATSATKSSSLQPQSGSKLLYPDRILTENYEEVNAGTPTFTGTGLTGTYNINSSSLYTTLENVKEKGFRPILKATLNNHTTVVSIPLTRGVDGTYTGLIHGTNGNYFIEASISSSSQTIKTKEFYVKPSTGIPESSLDSNVINKIETAVPKYIVAFQDVGEAYPTIVSFDSSIQLLEEQSVMLTILQENADGSETFSQIPVSFSVNGKSDGSLRLVLSGVYVPTQSPYLHYVRATVDNATTEDDIIGTEIHSTAITGANPYARIGSFE